MVAPNDSIGSNHDIIGNKIPYHRYFHIINHDIIGLIISLIMIYYIINDRFACRTHDIIDISYHRYYDSMVSSGFFEIPYDVIVYQCFRSWKSTKPFVI